MVDINTSDEISFVQNLVFYVERAVKYVDNHLFFDKLKSLGYTSDNNDSCLY